jgi:hypothetical protein
MQSATEGMQSGTRTFSACPLQTLFLQRQMNRRREAVCAGMSRLTNVATRDKFVKKYPSRARNFTSG